MTNEQLLKYFENRPKVEAIYVVGTAVFVEEPTAKKYAAQTGRKVDPKTKRELEEAFAKEKLNLTKLSKSEAEAKLKGLNLKAKLSANELSELVEALGLPTEGTSKKAYLDALTVAKEGLLGKADNKPADTDKTETSKA